jgi:hypothetical protein
MQIREYLIAGENIAISFVFFFGIFFCLIYHRIYLKSTIMFYMKVINLKWVFADNKKLIKLIYNRRASRPVMNIYQLHKEDEFWGFISGLWMIEGCPVTSIFIWLGVAGSLFWRG